MASLYWWQYPNIVFEDGFCLLPYFEKTINYLIDDYTNWVAIRLQGIHPAQQDVNDSSDDIQLNQNKADAVDSAAYIIKPAQAKLLIEAVVDIYESLDHFLEYPPVHHVDFLVIYPYPVHTTEYFWYFFGE